MRIEAAHGAALDLVGCHVLLVFWDLQGLSEQADGIRLPSAEARRLFEGRTFIEGEVPYV